MNCGWTRDWQVNPFHLKTLHLFVTCNNFIIIVKTVSLSLTQTMMTLSFTLKTELHQLIFTLGSLSFEYTERTTMDIRVSSCQAFHWVRVKDGLCVLFVHIHTHRHKLSLGLDNKVNIAKCWILVNQIIIFWYMRRLLGGKMICDVFCFCYFFERSLPKNSRMHFMQIMLFCIQHKSSRNSWILCKWRRVKCFSFFIHVERERTDKTKWK